MCRPARGRGALGCGQFPRFPALGACPRFAIPRGQARRTVIPGTSSNRASGRACTWSRWSSDGSRLSDSAAIYSAQPRLRVDSNVDGIVILADDESKRLLPAVRRPVLIRTLVLGGDHIPIRRPGRDSSSPKAHLASILVSSVSGR